MSSEMGPFAFISPHLLETPKAAFYGLAIETRYKLLICLSCPMVVTPSLVASHLTKKHTIKLTEDDHMALTQLLSLCRVGLSSLPELKQPLLHSIEGLPVSERHLCSCCPTVASNHESLKSHMRQKHKNTPYPDKDKSEPTQELQHGLIVRIGREDNLPLKMFTVADVLRQASELLEANKGPTATPTDPREICPWLRRVRWQDLTEGRDVVELMALVEMPDKDEFPLLSEAFQHLLRSASHYFDSTPELILQRLHTSKQGDT
jgi:hypothetical protein